jgi:shikimate 5-dehydrogenase
MQRTLKGIAQDESIQQLNFEVDDLESVLKKYPKALLIQCTSAPLRGDDLARFCPAIKYLKGGFVDLVYGSPSALLAEAESRKIICQDGIPMLIHQALLSQKLWWGRAATFSDIKSVLSRRS